MTEQPTRPSRRQRTFPGRPEHVSAARRFVVGAIGDAGPVSDVAELLVSETVTNAVLHSDSGVPGGVVEVTCSVSDGILRVEVGDQNGHGAGPRRGSPRAESPVGRGLLLVDGLADRWGVRETPAGRTTWFELRLDRPRSAEPAGR